MHSIILTGPKEHLCIAAEAWEHLCALPPSSAGDSGRAHTAEHAVDMEDCQVFVTGQGNPASEPVSFEEVFGRQLAEHKTLCLVLWLRFLRQLQLEL